MWTFYMKRKNGIVLNAFLNTIYLKNTSNMAFKSFCSLILGIFCFISFTAAQSYTTAAGIRLGTDLGITVQQRVAKRVTVEGILQSSLRRDEMLLTALLEKHNPVLTKRFNIYTGGGLHTGWKTNNNEDFKNPFGVTGVIGAEFSIGRVNLSYDFKPAFNITGGDKRFYGQTAVSARYIFVKQKVFNDILKKRKKKQKAKRKAQRKKDRKPINWKFWEN